MLTCERCGYEWPYRGGEFPDACANIKCKSVFWDKPRKYSRTRKPDSDRAGE